jgi:hypothetical protein
MKHILSTFILILAANAANAGGFYQMVTANGPAAETGTLSRDTRLAPLQEQVQKGSRRIAERETATGVAEWTYSALYLQVAGSPQTVIPGGHKIARGF